MLASMPRGLVVRAASAGSLRTHSATDHPTPVSSPVSSAVLSSSLDAPDVTQSPSATIADHSPAATSRRRSSARPTSAPSSSRRVLATVPSSSSAGAVGSAAAPDGQASQSSGLPSSIEVSASTSFSLSLGPPASTGPATASTTRRASSKTASRRSTKTGTSSTRAGVSSVTASSESGDSAYSTVETDETLSSAAGLPASATPSTSDMSSVASSALALASPLTTAAEVQLQTVSILALPPTAAPTASPTDATPSDATDAPATDVGTSLDATLGTEPLPTDSLAASAFTATDSVLSPPATSWVPLPASTAAASPAPSASAKPAPSLSNPSHPVTGLVVGLVILALILLSAVFFFGPRTYRALVCKLTGASPGPSSHTNSAHDEGEWVRRTGVGASRSTLVEEMAAVRAGQGVGAGGVLAVIEEEGKGRGLPELPPLSFQPPSVRSRSVASRSGTGRSHSVRSRSVRSNSVASRSVESVPGTGPDQWTTEPVPQLNRGPGQAPQRSNSQASSATHDSSGTAVSVLSVAALREAYPYRPRSTLASEHGVIIDMPSSTAGTRSSGAGSGTRSGGTPPSTAASTAGDRGQGGSPESFPTTPSSRNNSQNSISSSKIPATTEEPATLPVSASVQSMSPSITTSADLECSTIVTINPAPARDSPAVLQSAQFEPGSSVISSLLMARAGSSPGVARASFSSEDDMRSIYSGHGERSPQIGIALGSPYVGFEQFGQEGFGHSDVSLVDGARGTERVVFRGEDGSAERGDRAPSPALQPIPQLLSPAQPQIPVMARSIAMQRQREEQGGTRYLTPDLGASRFPSGSGSRFAPSSRSGSGSGSGHGDEYETATEGTHGDHDNGEVGNASLRSSGSSWGKRVYGVFRSDNPVTPELGFGGFEEGGY